MFVTWKNHQTPLMKARPQSPSITFTSILNTIQRLDKRATFLHNNTSSHQRIRPLWSQSINHTGMPMVILKLYFLRVNLCWVYNRSSLIRSLSWLTSGIWFEMKLVTGLYRYSRLALRIVLCIIWSRSMVVRSYSRI